MRIIIVGRPQLVTVLQPEMSGHEIVAVPIDADIMSATKTLAAGLPKQEVGFVFIARRGGLGSDSAKLASRTHSAGFPTIVLVDDTTDMSMWDPSLCAMAPSNTHDLVALMRSFAPSRPAPVATPVRPTWTPPPEERDVMFDGAGQSPGYSAPSAAPTGAFVRPGTVAPTAYTAPALTAPAASPAAIANRPIQQPQQPQQPSYGSEMVTVRPTSRATRGLVVSLVAPKGGVGKTTLSILLAATFANAENVKVILVDANAQQGDVAKHLRQDRSATIAGLVGKNITPESVAQVVTRVDSIKIDTLLAPAVPDDADPNYISPYLFCEIVDVLRSMYDVVVIDTPVAERFRDTFTRFVLPSSNFLLAVVEPSIPTVVNTAQWLRSITDPAWTDDPFPVDQVGIVLNRYREGVECGEDMVRSLLASFRPLLAVIPATDTIQQQPNTGIIATADPVTSSLLSKVAFTLSGDKRYDVPVVTAGERSKQGRFKLPKFSKPKKS